MKRRARLRVASASAGLSGGLLGVALGALMRDCAGGAAGLSVRLPGAGAAIAVVVNDILNFGLSGGAAFRGSCADWPSVAIPCHVPAVRVASTLYMCVGLPCDSTSPPIVGRACGLICYTRICSCLDDCGRKSSARIDCSITSISKLKSESDRCWDVLAGTELNALVFQCKFVYIFQFYSAYLRDCGLRCPGASAAALSLWPVLWLPDAGRPIWCLMS